MFNIYFLKFKLTLLQERIIFYFENSPNNYVYYYYYCSQITTNKLHRFTIYLFL